MFISEGWSVCNQQTSKKGLESITGLNVLLLDEIPSVCFKRPTGLFVATAMGAEGPALLPSFFQVGLNGVR